MPGGPDANNATPITSLPFADDSTPSAWNDEFWYSYSTPVDKLVRSTVTRSGNFNPRVDTYYDLNFLYEYMASYTGSVDAVDRPMLIPVDGAVTLYFRVKGATNPGPITGTVRFTLEHEYRAFKTVPQGYVLIPDDTAHEYPAGSGEYVSFPAAILNPDTGETIGVKPGVVAGESGWMLPTGETLLENRYANGGSGQESFVLYDKDFNVIADTGNQAVSTSGTGGTVGPWGPGAFFVSIYDTSLGGPVLWRVSADGDVDNVQELPVGHDTFSAGMSRDGTMYYAAGSIGAVIHTWDTETESAGPDLNAGVSGYFIARDSIKVLPDGTVLVGYLRTSPRDNYVARYDTDGTLLDTYQLESTDFYRLDRVQIPVFPEDEPTFTTWVQFGVFTPTLVAWSRFTQIRVSDGAVLNTWDQLQFQSGIGPPVPGGPTLGHSSSCPMLIVSNPELASPEVCCCACDKPTHGRHAHVEEIETATGPVLPQEDPSTREFQCVGGGLVPEAPDLMDAEIWVM
jgi:hypothetical protein